MESNEKQEIIDKLRRRQFEVAMSGDPLMLAWLGMQCLGQTLNILQKPSKDVFAVFSEMLDRRHEEYQAEDRAQAESGSVSAIQKRDGGREAEMIRQRRPGKIRG